MNANGNLLTPEMIRETCADLFIHGHRDVQVARMSLMQVNYWEQSGTLCEVFGLKIDTTKPARPHIGGIPITLDNSVGDCEIWFENGDGSIASKIVNLGIPRR